MSCLKNDCFAAIKAFSANIPGSPSRRQKRSWNDLCYTSVEGFPKLLVYIHMIF